MPSACLELYYCIYECDVACDCLWSTTNWNKHEYQMWTCGSILFVSTQHEYYYVFEKSKMNTHRNRIYSMLSTLLSHINLNLSISRFYVNLFARNDDHESAIFHPPNTMRLCVMFACFSGTAYMVVWATLQNTV